MTTMTKWRRLLKALGYGVTRAKGGPLRGEMGVLKISIHQMKNKPRYALLVSNARKVVLAGIVGYDASSDREARLVAQVIAHPARVAELAGLNWAVKLMEHLLKNHK